MLAGQLGGALQQRAPDSGTAAQPPPRCQCNGQAQRGGYVVFQCPGQGLVDGGVFGVQPAGSGRLSGAGFQPAAACSATASAYPARLAAASGCSPASASRSSPKARKVSSIT